MDCLQQSLMETHNPSNTQDAELENEARTRKRSKDKPNSIAGHVRYSSSLYIIAVNNAKIDQENDATQGNTNVQITDWW